MKLERIAHRRHRIEEGLELHVGHRLQLIGNDRPPFPKALSAGSAAIRRTQQHPGLIRISRLNYRGDTAEVLVAIRAVPRRMFHLKVEAIALRSFDEKIL